MNQTHLHLVMNHVAIIGTFFAAIVLLIGILSNSVQTKIASYVLLLISSIGGVITFRTGHEAEEYVEEMKNISHRVIEEHEEMGESALWFIGLIALAAVIGLVASKKGYASEKLISWGILLICLISFSVFAWTGYLGGQIMHP